MHWTLYLMNIENWHESNWHNWKWPIDTIETCTAHWWWRLPEHCCNKDHACANHSLCQWFAVPHTWLCHILVEPSVTLFLVDQLSIDTIVKLHNLARKQFSVDTIVKWHNLAMKQFSIDTIVTWHNLVMTVNWHNCSG